ncbi:unnamed protein product [Citrullus colocynthis]|uniref:Secreted protein n=1 Tax=Citrullus colocynthis TaxID=252529 RepID=A0ABP0YL32_9ROSI
MIYKLLVCGLLQARSFTRKSDFTPHRYTRTFPTKKQEKKWRSSKMEKMVGAEYLTKLYGHRFLLQTSSENLEFHFVSPVRRLPFGRTSVADRRFWSCLLVQ